MNTNINIMPSLRSVIFEDCPYLKALLQLLLQNNITPKQELKIKSCPILAERYNKEKEGTQPLSHSDWSKISHISSIEIDDQIIQPKILFCLAGNFFLSLFIYFVWFLFS